MTLANVRVVRALEGDRLAAAELVATLAPVIRRSVIKTLLRDRSRSGGGVAQEAEDMTQEVLLSLFSEDLRIFRAWQPERGLSLESFVAFVARRQALSLLRTRRTNPFHLQPTDPADLENQPPSSRGRDAHRSTEHRQSLERLALALRARLSPIGLEMFQRLFVEEQSVSDISRNTGLSAESVYQWRTRIKKAALEVRTALG